MSGENKEEMPVDTQEETSLSNRTTLTPDELIDRICLILDKPRHKICNPGFDKELCQSLGVLARILRDDHHLEMPQIVELLGSDRAKTAMLVGQAEPKLVLRVREKLGIIGTEPEREKPGPRKKVKVPSPRKPSVSGHDEAIEAVLERMAEFIAGEAGTSVGAIRSRSLLTPDVRARVVFMAVAMTALRDAGNPKDTIAAYCKWNANTLNDARRAISEALQSDEPYMAEFRRLTEKACAHFRIDPNLLRLKGP